MSSEVAGPVIQVWRPGESSRDCEDPARRGEERAPVKGGVVLGAGWRIP